jgi:hypothetical protein
MLDVEEVEHVAQCLQQGTFAAMRVMGMSGYTSQRTSGPRPDLLLQKPFRAANLLNAIHSLLSRAE